MKAIADMYGTANGALMAILAGADICDISHTLSWIDLKGVNSEEFRKMVESGLWYDSIVSKTKKFRID